MHNPLATAQSHLLLNLFWTIAIKRDSFLQAKDESKDDISINISSFLGRDKN
jgi:hypothetical protein